MFEDILTELTPLYEDIVILGDFNENHFDTVNNMACTYCVRNSCTKCKFSDVLDSVGWFNCYSLYRKCKSFAVGSLSNEHTKRFLCSTRLSMTCPSMT